MAGGVTKSWNSLVSHATWPTPESRYQVISHVVKRTLLIGCWLTRSSYRGLEQDTATQLISTILINQLSWDWRFMICWPREQHLYKKATRALQAHIWVRGQSITHQNAPFISDSSSSHDTLYPVLWQLWRLWPTWWGGWLGDKQWDCSEQGGWGGGGFLWLALPWQRQLARTSSFSWTVSCQLFNFML